MMRMPRRLRLPMLIVLLAALTSLLLCRLQLHLSHIRRVADEKCYGRTGDYPGQRQLEALHLPLHD